MSGVHCAGCGHYIAHDAMKDGTARHHFEPLSEFGPEVSEWFCAACIEKGVTP